MTAEATTSGARRLLVPVLALVAIGVVLRFTFVDLLTKATGTWIGGVESPHRTATPTSTSTSTPTADAERSAG